MTGEVAGYAMDKLLEEGALDVFYTPIYMKKNRPAIKLGVLCKEEKKEQLQIAILKYTTTIGLRAYEVERVCMERYFETVVVRDCEVPVKVITFQDVKKSMPEYENCKKLAMQLGISIQEVYNEVMVAIYNKKSGEE